MSKSASKDPHYRKILDALGGRLDPHLFEQCVVDLLRENFPALVPIPGGDDAGMDGAIADGEGEAYPFVATTDQHPIRNLTRSLDSYLAKGGRRRKVVMATSTALTARRRRALEERARERGFTLVQLFEQRALADRLYRCSRGATEHLGVTGRPSALSAVPMSRRPLREDVELIGRDEDLAWLRETSGDRILVGQPGSGKTFLALQLVREGQALFLADDDPTNIANAVRDLQPPVIVVDDAHVDLERLDRLRLLRQQTHATFDILAITWPGQEDDVADALGGLSSSGVRKLEGLTRREIVEVLRSLGIRQPDDDDHLRHLVAQTANKPGLAVTLGSLWLRGEWEDIVSGQAVRQSLIPSLKRVLEDDPVGLLACFALGGERGVEMEVVRGFLGLNRETMHRRAAAASHGGVLTVQGTGKEEQVLTVEPEALRAPLLQEVFFGDGPSLPWSELLEQVKDRSAAIEGLVTAALRGAEVPRGELRELVQEADSERAWRWFAQLGETEARWVLTNFPDCPTKVAWACLQEAPRPTVRRLLSLAGDNESREDPAKGRDPLELLHDWSHEVPNITPHEETLERREVIVAEALQAIERGEDRSVALRACFSALSPELESTRGTITGGELILRRGSLPAAEVPHLKKLWNKVRPRLVEGQVGREVWVEFASLLRQWVAALGAPEEDTETYHCFAYQMLGDLAPLAKGHPGLAHLLVSWGFRLGVELDLEIDPEFATLYPLQKTNKPDAYQAERRQQARAAEHLARYWAPRSPTHVATRLQEFQEEVAQFLGTGIAAPTRWIFYRELARNIERPEEWVEALIERGIESASVQAIIDRMIEDAGNVEPLIQRCFDPETGLEEIGVRAALRAKSVSPVLLLTVLERALPHVVQETCESGTVPEETLRHLLGAPRQEIALAAAVGEWVANPPDAVRPQVAAEWRQAILRFAPTLGDHQHVLAPCLERIFAAHPDLAAEWLRQRMEQPDPLEQPEHGGLHLAALQALDEDQRTELLTYSEQNHLTKALVPFLVGQSPQRYRELLRQTEEPQLHLEPLADRAPDDQWAELASLALAAGHDPADIAQAAFAPSLVGGMGLIGFGIEHWEHWRRAFERLQNTAEEEALREVARYGMEEAERRIEESRQQERDFALTGQFG